MRYTVIYIFLIALTTTVTVLTIRKSKITFSNLAQNKPLIRFNSDGKLKIAIFADLHYGEEPSSDWGPEADLKSSNVTSKILDTEHPDFIVFTGDQLTAENMFSNGTEYIDILVKPLVDRGYRWASVYGNHDIGPNVSRLSIFEAEQKYSSNLSYTMRMTNESIPGVTNYYLLIYPPEETNGSKIESQEPVPVMIWWFFDSQGGRDNDGQQPHHIDPKVIDWFRQENLRMKNLWGPLASLVFFHIPPIEYIEIQENLPTYSLCSGLVDDDVTPQDENSGIMNALMEAGGVRGVFVGHDHGNGWCCFFHSIQVCYGRHTGFGGYSTPLSQDRGSRIVTFELKQQTVFNLGSYIRLENGEIIDAFPKI